MAVELIADSRRPRSERTSSNSGSSSSARGAPLGLAGPPSTRPARLLPSWGLVTAEPHEFLIQIRRGRVVRQQQGGGCWRWPGDTVALVDTSVRRLQFTADQVTREKVGVQVTGLAVFRIVEPLLAYRTLDLGDRGGFEQILQEMFVGATRRLVANLGLEECITHRKDALALELMTEVAPVVAGSGRADDGSERGWGIAIDTIEVQDVRVQSQEVFANLQAPFREALEMEALRARAEVEAQQLQLRNETEKAEELARQRQMELEAARHEAEREAAQVAREHLARLQRLDVDAHLEREQARAAAMVRIAEQKADATRIKGEARADVVMLRRKAKEQVSPERLQELLLTETVPRVAEAFRGSFGQVVVTGGSDMDFLGQGLSQVLATMNAFGLRLPTPEGADDSGEA